MTKLQGRILARVNPAVVVVDSSLLQPTVWDQKVVSNDLKLYVSRSRLISATPLLHLRGRELFVVQGAPFLTAAKEATPPLSEVVCEIQGQPSEIRHANLQIIDVCHLLNNTPPDEVYSAINMIFFQRPLDAQEQQTVRLAIEGFFQEVSSPGWKYGGNYRRMEALEWNKQNDIVSWIWERSDSEGHDMIKFQQVLHRIDSTIAPIRSYNGIAIA